MVSSSAADVWKAVQGSSGILIVERMMAMIGWWAVMGK